MDFQKEKEAFEKHASKFFKTNEAFEDDGENYVYDEVKFMWDCWLAAKAHEAEKLKGCVLVPVQCPDPDFADSLFDELSKKAIGEFGDDLLIHFSDIDEEEIWALMVEAAKAQAVPEGFVLAEKSKIRTWYQDDNEPENFCNSESDLNCLGDCLDDDDIIAVNIHESAHISTRKVFGVWKSNSPTDIQSNFVLVDSREKAEEIVASNKAMIEAQEPTSD